MKRAIIYARVSSKRQADDGLPIESQLDRCRAKAEALGAEVLREFVDGGIIARTACFAACRHSQPVQTGFTARFAPGFFSVLSGSIMKKILVWVVHLVAVIAFGTGIAFATAAEPVLVIGVPIGGVLTKKIPVCPSNTDLSRDICWVGKPFVAKDGERLGTVHLPRPESLPAWAAYASFELTIAKDGQVRKIRVTAQPERERSAIFQSISARFGTPLVNKPNDGEYYSVAWDRPDIFIDLLCAAKCYVSFQSRIDKDELLKELAERKKVDNARPVSP